MGATTGVNKYMEDPEKRRAKETWYGGLIRDMVPGVGTYRMVSDANFYLANGHYIRGGLYTMGSVASAVGDIFVVGGVVKVGAKVLFKGAAQVAVKDGGAEAAKTTGSQLNLFQKTGTVSQETTKTAEGTAKEGSRNAWEAWKEIRRAKKEEKIAKRADKSRARKEMVAGALKDSGITGVVSKVKKSGGELAGEISQEVERRVEKSAIRKVESGQLLGELEYQWLKKRISGQMHKKQDPLQMQFDFMGKQGAKMPSEYMNGLNETRRRMGEAQGAFGRGATNAVLGPAYIPAGIVDSSIHFTKNIAKPAIVKTSAFAVEILGPPILKVRNAIKSGAGSTREGIAAWSANQVLTKSDVKRMVVGATTARIGVGAVGATVDKSERAERNKIMEENKKREKIQKNISDTEKIRKEVGAKWGDVAISQFDKYTQRDSKVKTDSEKLASAQIFKREWDKAERNAPGEISKLSIGMLNRYPKMEEKYKVRVALDNLLKDVKSNLEKASMLKAFAEKDIQAEKKITSVLDALSKSEQAKYYGELGGFATWAEGQDYLKGKYPNLGI